MSNTKIQDEAEVFRWFEEGRTYRWMSDKYLEKYNIQTVPSLWANFRRRKGLPRRIERNDELIPWAVKLEHRGKHPVSMLRAEARRRAGLPVADTQYRVLESWLETMHREGLVVYYDPDTEDGFFYVPREPGDEDLIRKPERTTSQRRNADNRE